jgi:hypothetical protein
VPRRRIRGSGALDGKEGPMTVAEVNAMAQAFHHGVANRGAAGLTNLYAEIMLDIFNSDAT